MPHSMEFPASFVQPWRELLDAHRDEQQDDFPNHHVHNLDSLITTSNPQALWVGTGHSIFTRALLPAILTAKHSVQFVTCFWAASPSLDALRETLLQLSLSRVRSNEAKSPLRISIGFSTRRLFQKLFHTSSRDGYIYPPSQWPMLGLPNDDEALKRGGIELTVKTLFFTPFSVMHPKFVIVDGTRAWVPSCNVSWERWFEGCVEVEGDIVGRLLAFHQRVWGIGTDTKAEDGVGRLNETYDQHPQAVDGSSLDHAASQTAINDGVELSASQSLNFTGSQPVPTIFLPSSHHRNPRFSFFPFFPFFSQEHPPMTPLNAALLTLFSQARRQITILTPNVTSWPVLEALLDALARGVDVQVRTSKGMMLIEQLVTAGTTTSWCLRRFINKYNQLQAPSRQDDAEAQRTLGKLDIFYYQPLERRREAEDEPVVSHFKMTLVDNEFLVLGSGNMDRASWWTSQELGLLFYLPGFEGHRLWEGVLEKRTQVLFSSHQPHT